jgi:hypothetical protein
MRDWKKFSNDEIFAVWKEYLITEFGCNDPLRMCTIKSKPMRLTPMEIHRLVEELMDRLEIKDQKA